MTPNAAPLDAGEFPVWIAQMRRSLDGAADSDVPCDGCTACCTSAQFIHIAPDETDTLAHIPAALRFPAPGRPAGHVLLGYDERGHCPMLIDGACSIYAHRPRTCRTYDCRVFAAAGVTISQDDKPEIARRVQRWRFSFPDDAARRQHEAVTAAEAFLRHHAPALPPLLRPTNATQLAVLAVVIHDLFLAGDGDTGAIELAEPALDTVRTALLRRSGAPDDP